MSFRMVKLKRSYESLFRPEVCSNTTSSTKFAAYWDVSSADLNDATSYFFYHCPKQCWVGCSGNDMTCQVYNKWSSRMNAYAKSKSSEYIEVMVTVTPLHQVWRRPFWLFDFQVQLLVPVEIWSLQTTKKPIQTGLNEPRNYSSRSNWTWLPGRIRRVIKLWFKLCAVRSL